MFGDLSNINVEEAIARQRENFAESSKGADLEAQNPFGRHRWVKLEGLTELNGRFAEIILPANEDDRFAVRVKGEMSKKLIKRSNLQPVADADTVKVCRLAAKGEANFVGGYIQNTRWPLAVLIDTPHQISQHASTTSAA